MSGEISNSYQNFQTFMKDHSTNAFIDKKMNGTTSEMLDACLAYAPVSNPSLNDDFSLMSADEAKNGATYDDMLSLFIADEINTKDKNGDAYINLKEYREANLAQLEEMNAKLVQASDNYFGDKESDLKAEPLTTEEKAKALAEAHLLFSIIDTSADNVLDKEELKLFYSEMDSFVEGKLMDSKDGTLDINQINSYKKALIDAHFTSKQQDLLADKYVEELEK